MANSTEMPAKSTGATVILSVPTHKRRKRPTTKEPKRHHARAVNRILDRETGAIVGWLYEWNTGELVPRWKSVPYSDVIYE